MDMRPDYTKWIVDVERLVVPHASTGRLRLRIRRDPPAKLPAERFHVRLQCTDPFAAETALGAQGAFGPGVVNSGLIEVEVTYGPETIVGGTAFPTTTNLFLRFFLDTNNPVGFVELTATINASALTIEAAENQEFLVPKRRPDAPRFVLYVTCAERTFTDEPDHFDLAVSRIDGSAQDPILRPLGVISNIYLDPANQEGVIYGCINEFNANATPSSTGTPAGREELWAWLGDLGEALRREILDQIDSLEEDLTLLVLTEDPRFPWEILAIPEAAQPDPSCDWLGQLFIMTRWLHAMPLPNDGQGVDVMGMVAPETMNNLSGAISDDMGEMYALREFSVLSRVPYTIEMTDGTKTRVLELLSGRIQKSVEVDYVHIRAHGQPTEFSVNADLARNVVRASPRGPVTNWGVVDLPAPLPEAIIQSSPYTKPLQLFRFDLETGARLQFSFGSNPFDQSRWVFIEDLFVQIAEIRSLYWGRANPPFIFFSACSVAEPSDGNGVSLELTQVSVTLIDLFARTGCAGFIAAMWLIDAVDSAYASAQFYRDVCLTGEVINAENRSGRPAAALRALRRASVDELNPIMLGEMSTLPATVRGYGTNKPFRNTHTTLAYTMFGHPNQRFTLHAIANQPTLPGHVNTNDLYGIYQPE